MRERGIMGKTKATGTKEWAAHGINIQTGCEHGCLYCYANANAIRYKRVARGEWKNIVPKEAKDLSRRFKGTVMFPTAHDITPKNIGACGLAIGKILAAGNKILIVSKPHLACIQELCSNRLIQRFKENVLWRFTIGTYDDVELSFWEPDAPSFNERMQALAHAFSHDFKTSVSCEPLLTYDVQGTWKLVQLLRPFVTDSIWIGRANHLKARLTLNCPDQDLAKEKAVRLLRTWDNDAVKRLYEWFQVVAEEPLVRWKNSIKETVGIKINPEVGMDV